MIETTRFARTILLAAVSLVCSTAGATIGFKPAQVYPVGTNPNAIATGDFNGDSKIDLVVVNSGNPSANDNGSVSILLGNGDGTFQTALDVAAGTNSSVVAVGDFNGDNHLDIAVNSSTNMIRVLLGNGDGTFQSPASYSTGTGPVALAVADFNGDNRFDLVVANAGSGTVSVLLGNGDGTFQSHVDYAIGGTPQGVAVADFDADGKADLAVPSLQPGVALLLGNGDGTFQSAMFDDAGSPFGPTGLASGDFNGDGKSDLIVDFLISVGGFPLTSHYRGDLLLGNGDGTFQLIAGVVALQHGSVSQADFNGDGHLDLVQPQGLVWAGNGDGTFQTAVTFSVGSSPSGVAVADVDRNKSPDIIVTNSGDNTISVVANKVGADFSISASPVSPSTLSSGQSAASTISLTQLNAFANLVSLTCAVQPAQQSAPACSLSSSSVTFDASGKGSATLTITASVSAASLKSLPSSLGRALLSFPVAGFGFLGTGIGLGLWRKKGVLGILLGALLFSDLMMLLGCGGGRGSAKSTAYTVTVIGASGATQHSAAVSVTVQ